MSTATSAVKVVSHAAAWKEQIYLGLPHKGLRIGVKREPNGSVAWRTAFYRADGDKVKTVYSLDEYAQATLVNDLRILADGIEVAQKKHGI